MTVFGNLKSYDLCQRKNTKEKNLKMKLNELSMFVVLPQTTNFNRKSTKFPVLENKLFWTSGWWLKK